MELLQRHLPLQSRRETKMTASNYTPVKWLELGKTNAKLKDFAL